LKYIIGIDSQPSVGSEFKIELGYAELEVEFVVIENMRISTLLVEYKGTYNK